MLLADKDSENYLQSLRAESMQDYQGLSLSSVPILQVPWPPPLTETSPFWADIYSGIRAADGTPASSAGQGKTPGEPMRLAGGRRRFRTRGLLMCEVGGQRAATGPCTKTSPVRFSSRPLPNAACTFQRTTLSSEQYSASPCCPPLNMQPWHGEACGSRAGATVVDVSDPLHYADGTSLAAAACLHPFPTPPCPPRAVCPGG
jgi:hypothetical protein